MFRIFESITECVIVVNENNQIEYVNPALERVFGYNPHELLNKSLHILIPETFSHKHDSHLKDDFQETSVRKMGEGKELSGRNKNGKTFPIEVSLSYTKVKNRTFAIAIVIDMTEQQKIIDELNLSKSLYSSLVENATDHIFQIDRNMTVQYINHVSPGLTKNKVIHANLLDLLPSEEARSLVKMKINQVFETGKSAFYESEYSSPVGVLYYSTIVSPVIKDGKVVGANLISRNLTEHINMKNNLLEQQRFIHKTNVYSLNGIYIFNLKIGKNTFTNESYKKILGYTLEDINNMNPDDFFACFHPDDQNAIIEHMNIVASLKEGESSEIEYRFKSKSGKWKWCKSVDSGFEYDDEGKLVSFIGSFIDITEQKKIEQDLKQKNKAIENFAHIVSHNLKTPLHNIILGLQYLNDESNENKEIMMENIISSAYRMNDMITSLLLSAKIDQKHKHEEFDTFQIIEEIKKDLSNTINENNAVIICDDLPIINGVATLFRTLLQNLIINSLKYKHPSRTPKISIQCDSKLTHWLFTLKDNGSGISKNDIEKIFKMFERGSKHKNIEGLGIGLANCQKIVLIHNGNIWVESEEGEGATFFFTIAKKQSNPND